MRRRRRFTSVVLAQDQRQGEQGLDQEKTLSGLRMQPAVVSHLMEACVQDMLKQAGKESDRIENEGLRSQRVDPCIRAQWVACMHARSDPLAPASLT